MKNQTRKTNNEKRGLGIKGYKNRKKGVKLIPLLINKNYEK